MTTTDRVIEHLNSLAPWALARLAECAGPDATDGPGARFLCRVRDSVMEDWERLTEYDGDPDYDGAVSEIADACVPIYSGELWTTFVDLGAYREDAMTLGPFENLDQAARIALHMISGRLVWALVEEGKELADAEEEDGEPVSVCPGCGLEFSYCQSHGDLGECIGTCCAILDAHDKGDHSRCHPDADCEHQQKEGPTAVAYGLPDDTDEEGN